MRTRVPNILSVIAALTATSCMALAPEIRPDENQPSITGFVGDQESNPIEHIMVTLEWGEGIEDNVLYTSSEGLFKTVIPESAIGTEGFVILTLTDIDGKENGGEFSTLTDKVMLFQELADSTSIMLDYRLNLSTPSENIPQS